MSGPFDLSLIQSAVNHNVQKQHRKVVRNTRYVDQIAMADVKSCCSQNVEIERIAYNSDRVQLLIILIMASTLIPRDPIWFGDSINTSLDTNISLNLHKLSIRCHAMSMISGIN